MLAPMLQKLDNITKAMQPHLCIETQRAPGTFVVAKYNSEIQILMSNIHLPLKWLGIVVYIYLHFQECVKQFNMCRAVKTGLSGLLQNPVDNKGEITVISPCG